MNKDSTGINSMWQFVSPTNSDKLQECLATDNLEQMQQLRESLGHQRWLQFLLSADSALVSNHCDANTSQCVFGIKVRGLSLHVIPTNPFYCSVYLHSFKIAAMMRQDLGERLLEVRDCDEYHLNLLHILLTSCVVHAQTFQESERRKLNKQLFDFVCEQLLTESQIRQMMQETAIGVGTPMEAAAKLGSFDFVQWLVDWQIDHCEPTQVTQLWLQKHICIDFSQYQPHSPNSRYFLSPLLMIFDQFGFEDVATLKEAGIFRTQSLFRIWIDAKMPKITISVLLYGLIITLLIITGIWNLNGRPIECLSRSYHEDQSDCEFTKALISACCLVVVFVGEVIFSLSYMYKRYAHLKRAKIFDLHHKGYFEIYRQISLSIICTISCSCLAAIFSYPKTFLLLLKSESNVSSLGNFTITILITTILYRNMAIMRLVPHLRFFFIGLIECLNNCFLLLSVLIITLTIFGNLFSSAFHPYIYSSINTNSTSTTLNQKMIYGVSSSDNNLWNSFYWTFMLSLNIVPDIENYNPNTAPIIVTILHIFLVFMVPIFFVNFIVAVLSEQFSRVREFYEEYLGLICLFYIFHLDASNDLFCNFQKNQLKLTFCRFGYRQEKQNHLINEWQCMDHDNHNHHDDVNHFDSETPNQIPSVNTSDHRRSTSSTLPEIIEDLEKNL